MEDRVLKLIKKHKKIVIARHIGGDPDAIGATFALKEIILANFPDKEVLVVGTSVARFKYFGQHDKLPDDFAKDALLMAIDIPDFRRLDGCDVKAFKAMVKMDHHPVIDVYSENDVVDEKASSASEIICKWCFDNKLKMPKHAAECIFMGIVADTNRFLFQGARASTFELVAKLIKEKDVNITELYALVYQKPMSEVKLEGFISLNMTITKNGVGYIKIHDKDLKDFGVDSASVGSIMNDYNFIDELLTWVVFTEDLKAGVIRTSARSRGPVINKLFEQYNGGGHIYACGAKLKSFSEADEIVDKLDLLCKNYKESEEDN